MKPDGIAPDRADRPAPDDLTLGAPAGGSIRVGVWVLHMALPLLGLWLLIAQPSIDVRWQDHPSHFWLVMTVAAINVVLGWRIHDAARDRADARLVLIAAAFVAAAGFLFLHALATPGVLLASSNTGFFAATPVGLGIAAVFAAASAVDLTPGAAAAVVRHQRWIRASLVVVLAAWAAASLAEVPPLNAPPDPSHTSPALVTLAAVSVGLYAFAAIRYFTIHRRRRSVMLIGMLTAFVLLGEAMVAVVFSTSWQLSWWLWHVLMTAGFGFVAYSAAVQMRREGSSAGLFDSVATEATVARLRNELGSVLDTLTSALERSATADLTEDDLELITAGLAARFDLSEGQTRVLGRAARALAHERDQARRLGALASVGTAARVQQSTEELLEHVVATVADAFGRDRLRIGLIRDGERVYPTELSTGRWDDDGDRIVAPLVVGGAEYGTVELLRPGGSMSAADRAVVDTLAGEISIAVDNARLYAQVDTLFRQYLSPDVASTLLADPAQAALGGATAEVTALFADLRGFTSFSERSSPEEIVELLNRYFGAAVPHVLDHGGTVVQFVGDAMLAVFNAPGPQPDHARQAARTALAMQRTIDELADGHPDWPRFRIGINTGPALVGNIGSDRFRSFNVMGDAINVAARLEGVAVPGTVVVGASTFEALGADAVVEPLGDLELKGKERPVAAYRLVSLGGA